MAVRSLIHCERRLRDCHCGEVVDKKCNKTIAIVDFALLVVRRSVGLPSTRRRSEGDAQYSDGKLIFPSTLCSSPAASPLLDPRARVSDAALSRDGNQFGFEKAGQSVSHARGRGRRGRRCWSGQFYQWQRQM